MKYYTSDGYWRSVLRGGLSKLFVLRALREGPCHGYALRVRVETMSGGFCVPSQGTIYPMLREFERAECVQSRHEKDGRRVRKVYTLTTRGRDALRAGLAAWEDGLAVIHRALAPPS